MNRDVEAVPSNPRDSGAALVAALTGGATMAADLGTAATLGGLAGVPDGPLGAVLGSAAGLVIGAVAGAFIGAAADRFCPAQGE